MNRSGIAGWRRRAPRSPWRGSSAIVRPSCCSRTSPSSPSPGGGLRPGLTVTRREGELLNPPTCVMKMPSLAAGKHLEAPLCRTSGRLLIGRFGGRRGVLSSRCGDGARPEGLCLVCRWPGGLSSLTMSSQIVPACSASSAHSLGLRPSAVALQVPVGDCDFSSGPVGLSAPSGPGRADTVVAVEGGFDG